MWKDRNLNFQIKCNFIKGLVLAPVCLTTQWFRFEIPWQHSVQWSIMCTYLFRSFLLKPVYLIVYPGLYLGNRFLDDRGYLIIQTYYDDFYFELLTYCFMDKEFFLSLKCTFGLATKLDSICEKYIQFVLQMRKTCSPYY